MTDFLQFVVVYFSDFICALLLYNGVLFGLYIIETCKDGGADILPSFKEDKEVLGMLLYSMLLHVSCQLMSPE